MTGTAWRPARRSLPFQLVNGLKRLMA